ncbi:MAG: MATE family efflux transporter [Treponema sp.]|nr:MATE family efflux transporter [Treponema sp.]
MRDFTSGSIARQLISFSIPMLIGNLLQQMYSIADMIIVGRYIGGPALASVGVSMSILMFVLASLMGLTTGASVVISQFYGARQYQRLTDTVSVSILSLLGISLILTVIGVSSAPLLLKLLNTGEEIFSQAQLYMRTIMAGVIFPVFYNMYTAYMRALGDSRRPLYFLIFSIFLNLGLNLFFVLVLDMGVVGVAIATVISQGMAALLCFFYARAKMPLLRVRRLIFDRELFRLILKYGTPAAFQLSLTSLAQLSITRLINSFGAAAMAGITAASRIDQFALMPVSNLSMALSTLVAQNMGAGLEDRARRGLRIGLLYMLVCAILVSALLLAYRHQFMSLFLSPADPNTPEILRIGSEYLNIMVLFYFLFAFLFAFNGFFRGAGDAVIAMVFPVFSLAVRALSAHGLVYLGGMGPHALAWSIPIGWFLSSGASFVYYKKRLWAGKLAVKPQGDQKSVSPNS